MRQEQTNQFLESNKMPQCPGFFRRQQSGSQSQNGKVVAWGDDWFGQSYDATTAHFY
jgi:hypothetical protein